MDLSRATWRKASRSVGNGDNCVEVATNLPQIAVRDSKNPTGPKLAFARTGWAAFARRAKGGAFDA